MSLSQMHSAECTWGEVGVTARKRGEGPKMPLLEHWDSKRFLYSHGKPPETGKRILTSELRTVGPQRGRGRTLEEDTANGALGPGRQPGQPSGGFQTLPGDQARVGGLPPLGSPHPLCWLHMDVHGLRPLGDTRQPAGPSFPLPLAAISLFPDLDDFLVMTFSPQLCPFSLSLCV